MSEKANDHATIKISKVVNDIFELRSSISSEDFIQTLPSVVCEALGVEICLIWKKSSPQRYLSICSFAGDVDEDYQETELDIMHPAISSILKKETFFLADISNIASVRLSDFQKITD